MKSLGYATGGSIGGLIKSSGEDGFALVRKGEYVLTAEQFTLANDMVTKLVNFAKSNISPISQSTNVGDVTVNMNFPNVKDGNDVLDVLKTKKAQNIIQSYTTDLAVGKNSLNKYKYK